MVDFADAHAIVTGGSSGIGRAVARRLASRGARVSLLARRQELLDETAADLAWRGRAVRVRSVDVTDRDAVFAAVGELTADAGPCDVLVTSAGSVLPGYFAE